MASSNKKRASLQTRPLDEGARRGIAELLIAGATVDDVAGQLAEQGFTERAVRRCAASTLAEPATAIAKELSRQVAQLRWQAHVHRTLQELVPGHDQVPRLQLPSRAEFLERFYGPCRPVVLTGIMDGWRAPSRWTWEWLKQRFGDVDVEVAAGRNGQALYDMHVRRLSRTVKLGAFLDWVMSPQAGNDQYMVANNNNLGRPELLPLLDDIHMPQQLLDPTLIDGFVYLWLGPAGTVTPLHHDTTNILFCQVVGSKRVKLISPLYTELWQSSVSYYSLLDAEAEGALPGVAVLEVDLGPGDALLLPAGWWHHVRSLSPSISVSMTNFVFPNRFEDRNPYASTR